MTTTVESVTNSETLHAGAFVTADTGQETGHRARCRRTSNLRYHENGLEPTLGPDYSNQTGSEVRPSYSFTFELGKGNRLAIL